MLVLLNFAVKAGWHREKDLRELEQKKKSNQFWSGEMFSANAIKEGGVWNKVGWDFWEKDFFFTLLFAFWISIIDARMLFTNTYQVLKWSLKRSYQDKSKLILQWFFLMQPSLLAYIHYYITLAETICNRCPWTHISTFWKRISLKIFHKDIYIQF